MSQMDFLKDPESKGPECLHPRWEEHRISIGKPAYEVAVRRRCFTCNARLGKHEFVECHPSRHRWEFEAHEYGGASCLTCGKREGSNGQR